MGHPSAGERMTTVVGIDPSLTDAGIAIIRDPASAATPNVPELKNVGEPGFDGADLIDRSMRVDRQFVRILRAMPQGVRLVVIEEVPRNNPNPRFASLYQERSALVTQLVVFLHKRKIPVVDVNVKTLKKFATGNGNAEKSEVIAAMKSLWPHAAINSNDNRSDALALASAGAMHLGWYRPEAVHHHHQGSINWGRA